MKYKSLFPVLVPLNYIKNIFASKMDDSLIYFTGFDDIRCNFFAHRSRSSFVPFRSRPSKIRQANNITKSKDLSTTRNRSLWRQTSNCLTWTSSWRPWTSTRLGSSKQLMRRLLRRLSQSMREASHQPSPPLRLFLTWSANSSLALLKLLIMPKVRTFLLPPRLSPLLAKRPTHPSSTRHGSRVLLSKSIWTQIKRRELFWRPSLRLALRQIWSRSSPCSKLSSSLLKSAWRWRPNKTWRESRILWRKKWTMLRFRLRPRRPTFKISPLLTVLQLRLIGLGQRMYRSLRTREWCSPGTSRSTGKDIRLTNASTAITSSSSEPIMMLFLQQHELHYWLLSLGQTNC